MSGCEDRDSAGSFIHNQEAESLYDIDTSTGDTFLAGILEAAESPRGNTSSDAIQAFDNLYKFITINLT